MQPTLHKLKYFLVYLLPATVIAALYFKGWCVWLPLAYVFGVVPFAEFFIKPNHKNLTDAEEALTKTDPFYDVLIYSIVPVLYGLVAYFLYQISLPQHLSTAEQAGLIVALGLALGVLGINVAHELGHRTTAHEQTMAKLLLLPALYTHFFVEHNKGHHKHVATPHDPASATLGENLYGFWVRSVLGSYASAWAIQTDELRKKNLGFICLQNEMLVFTIAQVSLLLGIGLVCGVAVLCYYVLAATLGFLLLETVNYIEHYGLSRLPTATGYERAQPHHSWNSNHVLGRLVLFELSRHSDHHYKASRKYQILQHHDTAPQMPAGYPAMMLLALVPPLWFWVMHRQPALKPTS
jgi:alkane 1-monooxygenase